MFCNLLVIIFIIFVGLFYVDVSNWLIIDKFVFYGWIGIFVVMFSCFYCFIGFDVIFSVSEEVIKLVVLVLLVIFLFLVISLFVYIVVIIVLIMMVFYYKFKDFVFFVEVFSICVFGVLKYIVLVGVLFLMFSSLIFFSFVMFCFIYFVVYDGLIFGCFIDVNKEKKILLCVVVVSGFLSVFLVFFFNM